MLSSSLGLESLAVDPTVPRAAFIQYFKATCDRHILTEKGRAEVDAWPSEAIQCVRSMPKAQFLELYPHMLLLKMKLGQFP